MLTLSPPVSAPAKIHCRIVSHFTELVELAPMWLDLLARSSANEPMLSPQWLLPWWEVYGENSRRQLRIGLFTEGDRLVGLAPLQQYQYWHRPGIPFRRLELLGADGDIRDGVCSEYLNLIIEQGYEERVVERLVNELLAGAFGSWDELLLPAMPGDTPLPEKIAVACRRAGLHAELQTTATAPHIPLPVTWDEYLHALGKHRRYVNKSLRDFAAWADGKEQFHLATSPTEVEAGKKILQQLHAERWQAAGTTGVFGASRFARFHDQALRLFFERQALQLHWLTVDGKPLAAVYNLRWNDKVYFYQSGRSLDVPNHIRLGIVLHAHCIQSAIAAGCREYDFLAGVSQYKQQLSLASRPLVQLRVVRPSVREWLRCVAEHGISLARDLRHKVRSLRKEAGSAD